MNELGRRPRLAWVPARAGLMRWGGVLLSLASLAALAWLVGDAQWGDLVRELTTVQLGWLVAAVGVALAVEIVKTVRWQILLGLSYRRLPELLGVVLTSRLLNALTPFRMGDVWRIAAATGGEGRPLVAAGGSVVVEKALDASALAVIGAGLFWPTGHGPLAAGLVGLGLLGALLLAPAVAARVGGPAWLVRALASLGCLRDGRVLAAAVGLTVVTMGLGVVVNLLVLRATGLPVDLAAGLVVLVAGYAAGLAPAGPGRVGAFELIVAAPLMALGIPAASSLAVAVALHVVLFVNLALGGLLALPLAWWSRSTRSAPPGDPAVEVRGA